MIFNRTDRLSRQVIDLSFFLITTLAFPLFVISASGSSKGLREVKASIKATQGGTDTQELLPGAPMERELAGARVHAYRIALTTGQYLLVTIDQRGVDLVAVLRKPDGERIIEMDGITGTIGREVLSSEATSGGTYLLEVRARAKQAGPGHYEVRIEISPSATAKNRARMEAERLHMEGGLALEEGRGEAVERAVKKYEEAVVNWRSAGDRNWEALELNNLGNTYARLSQFEKARDALEQALAITREIKDRFGEGLTLTNLGEIYRSFGQPEKARGFFEQALVIRREIKDRVGEAAALNNLGGAHESLSQYGKATEYLNQALAIRREVHDQFGEALTLNMLGTVHGRQSLHEKAIDYFERSLELRRELGDKFGVGQSLNNLGISYMFLSQYEKAGDYYEQTLAIRRELKDRYGEAITLHNLGNVSSRLGQYDKSIGYYEQALAISREIKNRRDEGILLSNLGRVFELQNQYDKASNYQQQSLPILREVKDRFTEGAALSSLGTISRRLGQYDKAREYAQQALAIAREVGDRSGEASTLLDLARLESDTGNLPESRKQVESALAVIENLRSTYINPFLRSAYFATVQNSYGFYIDLLMRMHKQNPTAGYDAAALQTSERARARTLLETLAESSANIRHGVDPQLIERERRLQRELNLKAQQQARLLAASHTLEQAKVSEREVEAANTAFLQVQAEIRRTSPRYAALTQPQPLSLEEIQTEIGDPETLLLEFSLGSDRSYLWAVSQKSLTSYVLPNRDEIEKAARRVYDALTAANRNVEAETPKQRALRLDQASTEFNSAASALSRMLLGPVANQLGNKRLIFVSDGALQYVPFAALPVPTKARGRRQIAPKPLVFAHEIVSLPSASVLAVLRKDAAHKTAAPRTVAVIADPVFAADDPRLRLAQNQNADRPMMRPSTSSILGTGRFEAQRSARESGLSEFERLRFSRQEADAIVSLTPAEARMIAVDFAANRATVTDPALGSYRILHLATHGLLNSQHPDLSGIVLSLVDESGKPQDGFLRLHEIYNLKLGADLVVLSACQTALGREIKGEGLVGLTRGFMYAGAPRVIASLWNVDDRATAELMKRFYIALLKDGRRPAEALRTAQLSMWKEPRWRSPHFWAAFVIQGEWR